MPKSAAFARMRAALLNLVAEIPERRVVETPALAEALNIPARHAAFILSGLKDDERAHLPWHRAVPKAGRFPAAAKRKPIQAAQIAALLSEGHAAGAGGAPVLPPPCFWHPPMDHAHTIWADEED